MRYRHLIKGKILDIGSKSRRYDYLFNGETTAIDINPNPKLNILKGDLVDLEFSSSSFDSVICIEVFMFLEPEKFKLGMNEILRVLKKKGTAIISFPFYMVDCRDNIRLTYGYVSKYLKQLKSFKFQVLKIGNKYTSMFDAIKHSLIHRRPSLLKGISLISFLFIFYLIIKILSLERKIDLFYSGFFVVCTKS